MNGTLRVIELFRSIQGESTSAGLPCAFVRLAGCNLQCRYCDTRYAATERGTTMRVDEVCRKASRLATGLVCITGGEPLLQSATPELAGRLVEAGHTVLVETNGTRPISVLPHGVVRVMDVKCPGSGECGKTMPGNIEALRAVDEVKFVLCDREDFDWAVGFVREHALPGRCEVLFAPAHGILAPRELARWVLECGLPVRLQLQLHKLLWPEKERGA